MKVSEGKGQIEKGRDETQTWDIHTVFSGDTHTVFSGQTTRLRATLSKDPTTKIYRSLITHDWYKVRDLILNARNRVN